MLRHFVLASVSLIATTAFLHAQQTPDGTAPAAQATTPDAKAASEPPEPMEGPQPGDHWTYESRDEITGDVKSTFVQTITDVAATEINVRVTVLGNPNNGYVTFDSGWNLTNDGTWRFTPNDGSGVRVPLSLGKTWPIKATGVRTAPNATWKRSGTAKWLGRKASPPGPARSTLSRSSSRTSYRTATIRPRRPKSFNEPGTRRPSITG